MIGPSPEFIVVDGECLWHIEIFINVWHHGPVGVLRARCISIYTDIHNMFIEISVSRFESYIFVYEYICTCTARETSVHQSINMRPELYMMDMCIYV